MLTINNLKILKVTIKKINIYFKYNKQKNQAWGLHTSS